MHADESRLRSAARRGLAVPGVAFIGLGLAWIVAPVTASPSLGMDLLDGVGRTSQIADLASFFLTLGTSTLLALRLDRRASYVPSMLLVSFAAFGRIIAWAVHGGALTADAIAVEVVMATWLGAIAFTTAGRLPSLSNQA